MYNFYYLCILLPEFPDSICTTMLNGIGKQVGFYIEISSTSASTPLELDVLTVLVARKQFSYAQSLYFLWSAVFNFNLFVEYEQFI